MTFEQWWTENQEKLHDILIGNSDDETFKQLFHDAYSEGHNEGVYAGR